MDFKDQIKQLASKMEKMLPQINTEEATKTSLIMPFIQILGYVYDGKATEKVVNQFTEISKKSLSQFVSDIISERLKTALEQETAMDKAEAIKAAEVLETPVKDDGIKTTSEENEGYLIVKSILRENFAVNRIVGRDTKSYFGILLDDNNRKPLARLHFNGSKKYISFFDKEKTETKMDLTDVDGIYGVADRLLRSVEHYEVEG